MRWWAATRHVPLLLVCSAAVILLVRVWGGTSVPVPISGATTAPVVPVSVLLPLALSTALALGLTARQNVREATATRHLNRYDLSLVLGLLAVHTLAIGLVFGFAVPATGWLYLRSLAFSTGLTLLVATRLDTRAAAAITVFVYLAILSVGRDPEWVNYIAVIRSTSPPTWANTIAALALLTGLSSLAASRPRTRP